VDVLRFGMMAELCSVDYCTEDAYQTQTYNVSRKYAPVSGTLTFPAGQVFRTIQVPVVPDSRWEPMYEFKIRLSNPVNCRLGRYLFVARCKIIDNDQFPTNNVTQSMHDAEENVNLAGNASDLNLMFEYFKLNYEFNGVGEKTRVALAIDQLQNLYFLLTTYLVTYVTDDILGPNPDTGLLVPDSRDLTLLLVGALYIVPYVILYWLDEYKTELRIAEISRSSLQENIFSTYLIWSESTRKKVPPSQVTLAVSRDAIEIVETGYMKIFEIAKNLGRLAVSAGFIVAENPDAMWLLVFFSAAIVLFISLRYRDSVKLIEEASEQEEAIVETVQESLSSFRVIRDYSLNPQIQEVLQSQIDAFNEASVLVAKRSVARDYFPGGLSTILLALYIPAGGEAVISGSLPIGVFLATVNLFKEAGSSYSAILNSALDITKAIEPITKVTSLMNLRSMSPRMRLATDQRRAATRTARAPENLAELRRNNNLRYGSDAIPIELRNVYYRYQGSDDYVLNNICVSVPQGRMVAVVGPRKQGKSTFMKLLGQVIQPTSGELFVPSYMRILHVCSRPVILKGSVWDNLAVGQFFWNDREFQVHRAMRICRRFQLPQEVILALESTKDQFLRGESIKEEINWRSSLTQTDLMMITLARAFIYDPAVMVLNQPTSRLPSCLAMEVVKLMREFVDQRGIEIPLTPQETLAQRRPRTVFASFVRCDELGSSDVIWSVEGGTVVEADQSEVQSFVGVGTGNSELAG